MILRLDQECRAFFGSKEVLRQIELLQMTLRDFASDVSGIFGQKLGEQMRELASKQKGWTYREGEEPGDHYFALIRGEETNIVRVEFGFTPKPKFVYEGLPRSPWVGVWTNSGKPERLDEIRRLTSACFTQEKHDDPHWPIFEDIEPWPDLGENKWEELYYLTGDECEKAVKDIVDKIAEIVTVLGDS